MLKYRLQHTADDEAKFRDEALAFLNSVTETIKSAAASAKPAAPMATLKIGLTPSDNPGIADGIAAVRYVRQHAADYKLNPDRIGMLGFSAGGAVTVGAILYGNESSRLNFAAPIYGAFKGEGKWPGSTPPMFLAVSADDPVAAQGELDSFTSLRVQKLPVELHVFEAGGMALDWSAGDLRRICGSTSSKGGLQQKGC